MEYALQEYPQLYSEENKNVLIKNLDEGFDKGYTYNIAILQYVVAKQSAVKNNIDFATLETQLKYTISTPLETCTGIIRRVRIKINKRPHYGRAKRT